MAASPALALAPTSPTALRGPQLRLVEPRPAPAPVAVRTRVRFWWRRVIAVIAIVAVAYALTVAVGRVGAEADLANPVAGHVVLHPGDTLWEVAVATAPDGMDPREQLQRIRALNGFSADALPAWTVVLVPAR